jgi:hypothetical protein
MGSLPGTLPRCRASSPTVSLFFHAGLRPRCPGPIAIRPELPMTLNRTVVASSLLIALQATPAGAQQPDMQAMMRWASSDVVRYHIVGAYQAQTTIASDGSGLADVSDGVVIDLTWKLSESKLVGAATFQNSKTAVSNLRDRERTCLPPVLEGNYEHYEILGIKDGLGGALEMQVKTTYPVVEIAQSCTASRKAVPAKIKTRPEELVIPSPVMFAMPLSGSKDLSISADKKSLIVQKAGWTWTFTPTAAAGP